MNENVQVRIDVEAAKALVNWKALFADQVCEGARRILAESGQPGAVTISHYRQAAKLAIRSLSAAIENGDASDGDQEAA